MSIAPVSSFPPDQSESAANQSAGSSLAEAGAASGTTEKAPPISEPVSKQESSAAKNVPVSYELPQDVVEMHQDPDIKNQVIIQYLDKGKNVVLQVPSNQELGVERGIAQDFQRTAKLRASEVTAASASKGEKTHGD